MFVVFIFGNLAVVTAFAVLDPWLCVPVFQRVCSYRIDRLYYSNRFQDSTFHFGKIALQECNAFKPSPGEICWTSLWLDRFSDDEQTPPTWFSILQNTGLKRDMIFPGIHPIEQFNSRQCFPAVQAAEIALGAFGC